MHPRVHATLASFVALTTASAAQVTTISALRENAASACIPDSCDTPDPVTAGGFDQILPAVAHVMEGQLGPVASATASQNSAVPSHGPYTGHLMARASGCCIQFPAEGGETSSTAESTYSVSFELTEACVFQLSVSSRLQYVGGSRYTESVSLELAGPNDETFVLEPYYYSPYRGYIYDWTSSVTRELVPGEYTFSVRVAATAVSNAPRDDDEEASALTTTCTFRASFTCQPESCPCEFDADERRIDVGDLLVYAGLWLNSDSLADFDGGGISITDLLLFLDCWFDAQAAGGGCP